MDKRYNLPDALNMVLLPDGNVPSVDDNVMILMMSVCQVIARTIFKHIPNDDGKGENDSIISHASCSKSSRMKFNWIRALSIHQISHLDLFLVILHMNALHLTNTSKCV